MGHRCQACCSKSSLHVPVHDPVPRHPPAVRDTLQRGTGCTDATSLRVPEAGGGGRPVEARTCQSAQTWWGWGQGSRMQRGAACRVRTLVSQLSTPHEHY